ncbi:MAG TPA: hypothetical protein VFG35_12240 [Actinoplanes sp.]|nr:hypothetical protein [Actinoplanes sp.]
MSRGVDQAALAAAAVAGIISISSAEGRYEPFDATIGIVLAILLACFYRPPVARSWKEALPQATSAAAVFALLFCIVIAPVLDAQFAPLSADLNGAAAADINAQVSWQLFWTWLITFIILAMLLYGLAVRPRRVSPAARG